MFRRTVPPPNPIACPSCDLEHPPEALARRFPRGGGPWRRA